MSRTTAFGAVTVIGVLSLLLVSQGQLHADRSSPTVLDVESLFVFGTGCNNCRECGDFGHEHFVGEDPNLDTSSHDCIDYAESCQHTVCGPEAPDEDAALPPEHTHDAAASTDHAHGPSVGGAFREHHPTHEHDPSLVTDVRRDLDAVAVALSTNPTAFLDQVRAGRNQHIRYSVKRNAVQVLGCRGDVLAHFPVM